MMLKSLTISSCALAVAISASASLTPLQGFYYGNDKAPGGHEWQSVDSLAYNKELPRATFYPFPDAKSALCVLPDNARALYGAQYVESLDGDWRFSWVPNPWERPLGFYMPDYDDSSWDLIPVPSSWNIIGLQSDGSQRYGTPIYVNQPVIFQHKVAVDDWRGGVMRTPPENWTTYTARNEVGSYRRSFEIPASWDGREVYVQFDGVDSFFYLWINGSYVGFSKNSRNAARFNITPYIRQGENTIAVEVYRSSDGSFLEAQDMFRLPGIFRSVQLYATPQVQIRDLVVIPDLINGYTDGELHITTDIRNLSKKDAKGYSLRYSLYPNPLYSDEVSAEPVATATSPLINVKKGQNVESLTTLSLAKPNLWSAEAPYRYTLLVQLLDKKGEVVENTAIYTGFRKVELRDTPASEDEFGLAGRYYYVNGKPVKLKGVNRHESNPARGHAITPDQMMEEVILMKRANINHVRNSHYPDHPYWYYLCDKYGIYLEDEANIESHEYYYGKASLSHPIEWRPAHVARDMEMVHSNVNSPAIVIWSLGNEAGPGENFVACYEAIKAFDTSRPVQYERNNDIVDIGSNQYPSIDWVRGAVKGDYNIKYPFHISEYAHSMGNALGNLVDYWDAIESTNHFMGGAIWDWIDQSLYNYDATGTRYLAYGGDFGDTPNDGQFVMNGILFGDLTPKPQYYEVKKVYQNIGVTPVDMQKGLVEVFNKNYFTPIEGYNIEWTLYEDGTKVQSGSIAPELMPAPRQKAQITIPYDLSALRPESEYFVVLKWKQAQNVPWAPAGYVQMAEQLAVKAAESLPLLEANALQPSKNSKNSKNSNNSILQTQRRGSLETITGPGFVAVFDLEKGTLHSLRYDTIDVIVPGQGPVLDAFRAFTNNDNWVYTQWFDRGLHNLQHKVTGQEIYTDELGRRVLSFNVESQAPNGAKILGGTSSGHNSVEEYTDTPFTRDDFRFSTNQVWTVYPDGSIELQSAITSNEPRLNLPRLGYVMAVPAALEQFSYYGRGPVENYADRKTGQFVGRYDSTVKNQVTPYTKPQTMANHEEVRWAALTNGNDGLLVIADSPMAVEAIPYTEMDLMLAPHPYQLPPAGDTQLHLSLGVTGLGGNSCGQGGPLEPDRVKASDHTMGLIFRPAHYRHMAQEAKVSGNGPRPFTLSRDMRGNLRAVSADTVMIQIDGAEPIVFTEAIPFKQGGSVKAWLKANPAITASEVFPRIETIDTEVIYADSQEPDYGEAYQLVDGDPTTIWHTMWSVTVAPYPHWVDFDAGSEKLIRGLIYTPQQESNNGNIKDYEIYVSNDPEQWGEPVAKGTWENNLKAKKVMLSTPVRGRYIRLRGLNAQNGREYAAGAEVEIIAE